MRPDSGLRCVAAMALSLTVGTVIGVLSGLFRLLDGPLRRFTDLFLALPVLPLLMVSTMLFREPLRAALGLEAGIFILVVGVFLRRLVFGKTTHIRSVSISGYAVDKAIV